MQTEKRVCSVRLTILRQWVVRAKMRYPPIDVKTRRSEHGYISAAVYLDAGIMSATNRGSRLHRLHLTEIRTRTWKTNQPRVSEDNCCMEPKSATKKKDPNLFGLTFHTHTWLRGASGPRKTPISIKLLTVPGTSLLCSPILETDVLHAAYKCGTHRNSHHSTEGKKKHERKLLLVHMGRVYLGKDLWTNSVEPASCT